jgi:hypothetical protein
MQPIALTCPNCGAGLGGTQGGEYLCAYCGHRSVAQQMLADQVVHDAMLRQALAEQDGRRAELRSARQRIVDEMRQAQASTRRINGIAMLGVGGLFLCIGLAIAVGVLRNALVGSSNEPIGGTVGFVIFWLVFGASLLYVGIRYGRADRRERRLRASGVHGRATIASYQGSSMELDGNPRYELVLRIELVGRPPYTVKRSEWVPRSILVTPGRQLPAFVDPRNPEDVLVDWFAA